MFKKLLHFFYLFVYCCSRFRLFPVANSDKLIARRFTKTLDMFL